MKTVLITNPHNITVTDTPMPEVKKGEALLQIMYCGICGADVASYTGNQPFTTYPRIPGHEFSAKIVSVPENNRGLKPGDIVTANPYFNCGSCYSCERGHVNCCTDNQTMGVQRDGSFCEYVAMPVERIFHGKGLSAKQLALIEPFSIGYHAMSRVPMKPTDKVLIVGSGPIGLFALISAKLRGATVYVTDLLEGRLEHAKIYGADGVIDSGKVDLIEVTQEITKGNGFDVCVEACGLSATFLSCIECAAFAGSIVLIGNGKRETTFNHSILLKKELNVFGSRNSYSADFRSLIDLVAAGRVDVMKMVSDIYPIDQADAAFRALSENSGNLMKVLVEITAE
ncbi:MAG: zinc-binding alcohol dehydrogenase family protein [Lachnospiraceae bacterium]